MRNAEWGMRSAEWGLNYFAQQNQAFNIRSVRRIDFGLLDLGEVECL